MIGEIQNERKNKNLKLGSGIGKKKNFPPKKMNCKAILK